MSDQDADAASTNRMATLGAGLPDVSQLDTGGARKTSGSPVVASSTAMSNSILRIPVEIQVVIGSARVPLSQVTQMSQGTIITLDQRLGAPATILVNGKVVAKGDLFVIEGEANRLGITITDIHEPGGAGGG